MQSLLGSRLVPSLSLLCITISLCSVPLSTTQAQIQPPANTSITSSGLNTVVSAPTALPNGQVNYDITGGTRPGGGPNLFHSFGEFSVATNHIANFLNETALPTSNIIGRINGGQVSNIWGTIQTTGFGAANLYLTNPSGFIFGPTASLNVGGSFAAATADYLRMTDGAKFYADPVQPSVLSIGNVAAFGFTSPRPVAIAVQATTLQVATDQTLSLIGGDITITNSVLRAASGQINLASVASAGEAIPNQPDQAPALDVSSFTDLGQITESSVPGPGFFSNLTVSSSLGAGTIVIRAGEMTLDNSFMNAQNLGVVNANLLGLDIAVTGDLIFRDSSSALAQTINANGAGMRISADRLVLESFGTTTSGFSGFNSSTFGAGRAGDITISARTIEARGNTGIGSNAFASGRGGDVQITADQMVMDSLLQGTSLPFGSTVSSSVRVTGGIGQPGAGTGQGGIVRLNVGELQLLNGAQVITATSGSGAGGAIDVQATNLLVSGISLSTGVPSSLVSSASDPTASGTAGNIHVQADSVIVQNGGQIRADLLGGSPGNAGNVDITARTVDVGNRGLIVAAAVNGTGNAGNVDIAAKDVRITGIAGTGDPFGLDATGIATSTNAGRGGELTLRADRLAVTDSGTITSRTIGSGNAGTVDLQIANSLSLATGGSVSASTSGTGSGGSITATTPILTLTNGAAMTAQTSGTGNAGSITLNTTNLSLLSGGQIATSSTSTQANAGKAGSIAIQGVAGAGSAADSLLLSGTNSLVSTTTAGPGQGGNIQIKAGQIQVEQLAKVTAETSGKGQAGNVTITGDSLTVASGGRIEASTAGEGKGGEIAITTTGDVTVSGVSGDGQTRSGIFAKTQTSSGTAGGGSGGGGSGGGDTAAKPGNAGNITIAAKNLLLNGGAQIDSSTTSGGGGNVSIATTENITIAGSSTRLTSDATRGDGKGGSITLVAKNITVADSASVTAATGGKGDAGNISLTALDQLLLQSAGTVTTSTSGSGKGGTITIQVGQVLLDGPGTGIAADTLRPFADLTITINILHQNDGDLIVQLDSPTGTRVALLSRVGGTGDNFTGTQFNDQATTQITSGSAPFTGTFKPREPLGQLINELVAGNWTLNVRDQATGNVGTLQNWTLQIGSQTFQSTGTPKVIPDNGTLRSPIAVAVPAGSTVLGVGEAPGIGGDVTINAGTVTVQNGATLSATTRGSGQGGIVTVNATGPVSLSGPGSGLFTDSEASGGSGNINVAASRMTLDNGAKVSAASSGTGAAGSIMVNAKDVTVTGVANSPDPFVTDFTGFSVKTVNGPGGMINFVGDNVSLSDKGSISSLTSSTGNAGSITFQLAKDLTVTSGSSITASTSGAGTGGTINVMANQASLATGGTITASTSGTGNAGNITLNTTNLSLLSSGQITTSSTSTQANAGKAGSIAIQGVAGAGSAADSLLVSGTNSLISTTTAGPGQGGNIQIKAGQIQVEQLAKVTAETSGKGQAGNVTMTGDSLTVASGGRIEASTADEGSGGEIVLNVDTLTVNNSTISSSSSWDAPTAGNAGSITIQGITGSGSPAAKLSLDNSTISTTIAGGTSSTTPATIDITAQTVNLTNGTLISADTSGTAPAGSINITAGGVTMSIGAAVTSKSSSTIANAAGAAGLINIVASGTMQTSDTTIATSANQGQGGNLSLSAGNNLNLLGGTSITAETTGTGTTANSAGNVHLAAGNDLLMRGALVSTKTVSANASGGNIKLTAPNLVRIVDSTLTSSVQGQAGSNGGNINIDPQLVVIQNSQLLANANAGAGGNITIAATGAVLIDPNSLLSASAGPAGVSGSVNINAPIQVLSGALVPLTQSFLSGNSLSNQRCAARMAQGQISTFIVTEREGLPQEPGGMLLSSLIEIDGTAASETIEPIRVASVSQSSFTPLTPEPVQLTWTDDTCRR